MEVGFDAAEFVFSRNWSLLDIHLGKVLFRLPDLELLSPQRAIEEFGTPQRVMILRKDGALVEKGLPEYLVMPVEYNDEDSEFLNEVQLIDFGDCMYPWIWALLLDLLKDCSTILYFESPENDTHTNVALSF